MKTSVPSNQNIFKTAMLILAVSACAFAQAQTSTELKFENVSLYSGTAGANGAVYKFPLINNDLDALVTITGRSSALATINNIDIPSQGFSKAFQPQIQYNNGNVSSATTWWIEFLVQFVNKNTVVPATINNFNITGVDIDGNGGNLKEWDAFYGNSSYTVENNTLLTVSNVTGTINQPTLAGKKFIGSATDYPGIDTSATEIMATVSYINTSSVTIRMGATTTGSASNANRMYSAWFKNFNYSNPITILPVKLASFTATLNNNNKADLKWTTASEINVSHFVIERSTDGTNYSDVGVVFTYGNATDLTNYSFSDNLNNVQSAIVYYRLRSVDIDGKSQYSDTRIIRISKQAENTITITTYPNPVTNELHISIPNNWQNKKIVYEVLSANGQTSKRMEMASSSQTETVNMSSYAPGFYVVRVICEGQTAQQKIVKQ